MSLIKLNELNHVNCLTQWKQSIMVAQSSHFLASPTSLSVSSISLSLYMSFYPPPKECHNLIVITPSLLDKAPQLPLWS